jgi:hypothetical protein
MYMICEIYYVQLYIYIINNTYAMSMCIYICYIYIHVKLVLYFFIPFVSFPLLHKTSTCGLQPQCTKRLHRYHEHC